MLALNIFEWTGLSFPSPHIRMHNNEGPRMILIFFFLLRYIADFRPLLRGDNTLIVIVFGWVTRLPRDRH